MEILRRAKTTVPEVSVICLCYNHEQWLAQCLDSLISQDTNFDYEIVIHDVASTDQSIKILKDYYEKYSDKITLIIQEENKYSQNIKIFPKYVYPNSYGKYFSICECDDYFVSALKLQEEYDFMERHAEFSLVCHGAYRVDAISKDILDEWRIGTTSCEVRLEDLIKVGGMIMPTNSMFFRSSLVRDDLPQFYYTAPVGDTPLMIYLGFKGKVYYIDKILSAYQTNISTSKTAISSAKSVSDRKIEICAAIEMYKQMDEYSDYKYHDLFQYAESRVEYEFYCFSLNVSELKRNRFKKFRDKDKFFWVKIYLRKMFPQIYAFIKRLCTHRCIG